MSTFAGDRGAARARKGIRMRLAKAVGFDTFFVVKGKCISGLRWQNGSTD
jgi:hypothetical protein